MWNKLLWQQVPCFDNGDTTGTKRVDTYDEIHQEPTTLTFFPLSPLDDFLNSFFIRNEYPQQVHVATAAGTEA